MRTFNSYSMSEKHAYRVKNNIRIELSVIRLFPTSSRCRLYEHTRLRYYGVYRRCIEKTAEQQRTHDHDQFHRIDEWFNKLWKKNRWCEFAGKNRYIYNIVKTIYIIIYMYYIVKAENKRARKKYDCWQLPFIIHALKGWIICLRLFFISWVKKKCEEILSYY